MLRTVFLLMVLSVSIEVASARTAVVERSAFACTSWAAWHEYNLASMTPKGAHETKLCPIRLKAGSQVEVMEDDDGSGASIVKSHGKTWFIDTQRLK